MRSADVVAPQVGPPRQQPAATPLAARPVVISVEEDRVVTRYVVRAEEPVFAGHYPGFPIFPGVCVLEVALASAHQLAEEAGLRSRLSAMDSVRFVGPTFPGDELSTTVRVDMAGDVWRCSAKVEGAAGPAMDAKFRLEVRR